MTPVEGSHDTDWAGIPLPPDDAFDAISNRRRRIVIQSLARTEDPVAAGDLAVEIAAIENGVEPQTVTGETRTAVYVTLTQNHLDKLDELGAADYDDRSKQVTATAATQPLARVISNVQGACYKITDEEAKP